MEGNISSWAKENFGRELIKINETHSLGFILLLCSSADEAVNIQKAKEPPKPNLLGSHSINKKNAKLKYGKQDDEMLSSADLPQLRYYSVMYME